MIEMRATAEQQAPVSDGLAVAPSQAVEQGRRKATFARAGIGLAIVALLCAAAYRPLRQVSLDHRLAKAREALRDFHPEAAIDSLTKLVAVRPDCAEAEFLLAAAYRHAGRLDMVEPHLRRAAELGWDADEIDRQACLTFFQAGDFRRAGAELMQRMQEGASDDEAEEIYEAMGRGYTSAMLLKQAAFIFEAWLGWRPQSARARLLLADVAALRGDQEGEINCYREAVRFRPSNVEVRRRLARALMLSHEVDEAYELFLACFRDRPGDPEVLVGLAECEERHGRRDEAKKLLEALLASHPNDQQRSAALALHGQIALAERDYTQAVRVLQEAVDAHPANLPAVYSLSQALSHADRADEANTYLDRWRIAQAAEKKLDELHEQILSHPEDPDLRAQVGQALMDQGATNAGTNWLLSVLYYHPSHPFANRLLAECYERAGQRDLAAHYRAISEGKIEPASESSLMPVPAPAANQSTAEEGAR